MRQSSAVTWVVTHPVSRSYLSASPRVNAERAQVRQSQPDPSIYSPADARSTSRRVLASRWRQIRENVTESIRFDALAAVTGW